MKVSIFLPIASHNRAFLTFTPEYILTPSPCLLWAHTQKAGHCWLRGNIGRLKNRISNHFIKGIMWSSHASYISYSTTGTSQHNIVTPPRALPLQDEGDYRNESHHYRLPPSLPPTNIPPPSIFKRTKATVVRFPKAANYSPSRCTGDGSHVVDLWSPRGGCGREGRGFKKKKGGGGKKQSLMKTENFGRLNLKWLLLWGGDGKHTTGFTVTRLHTCWVSLITQSARNTTGCCEWTGLARNSYCVYKCRSMGWTLLCGNLLSPFQTPSAALVTRLLNYRLFLKTRKSLFQLISVNLC